MDAKFDVVICGNIRTEIAFYEVLREVDRARDLGLTKRVVFSTWASEAERFPALVRTLVDNGVDVVMLEPLKPYSGSMPIQQMQMWRGLQALGPEPGLVLRTRTEKALWKTAQTFDAITSHQINLLDMPRASEIFDNKIVVSAVAMNELFPHIDFTMLASKDDFRRLLNVDAAYDYVFGDLGYFPVEARWFANPIRAKYPQLTALYERVNMQRLCKAIAFSARRCALDNAPNALFDLLAAYWRLCFGLFALQVGQPEHEVPTIQEMLAQQGPSAHLETWGDRVLIYSREALAKLGEGRLESDPLWPRLRAGYETSQSFGAAIEHLDTAALQRFCDDVLGESAAPAASFTMVAAPTSPKPLNKRALVEALALRAGQDFVLTDDIHDRLEATLTKSRAGDHHAMMAFGYDLAREGRVNGDAILLRTAFMVFLHGAWARIPEAVDEACALAFEGWVGEPQRREAFNEPVYTMFVQGNPIGKFWFGVSHIYSITGGQNVDLANTLIQEAADAGFERAQKFQRGEMAPGWPQSPPNN